MMCEEQRALNQRHRGTGFAGPLVSPPFKGGGAEGDAGGQFFETRRMRSEGVTMSVNRMPNLSFTTTTSPWAIR